ncbi:DDE-type integrase/transposase/recombinase [Corynebacterium sp. EPI-003-04-2554_SCH2473622]|uniref:DDE-type integrase/transposase/recombinase n=1 Tax=Corynebacterium sp. EPI-003-04-2554_SCH2473622 TaxID=1834153 RepID=UPI003516E365
MRLAGLSGKGWGPVTTRTPKGPDLRPGLVNREFKAPGLGKLWVADITYVRTRKGFVYTAFVTDVFSRRIVGWAPSDSMRTSSAAVPGDCQCQGNFQGWFTIVTTARSMSALSTMSDFPSTGSLLLPGLLVIYITMLWLKTLTAPHKG